MISRSRVQVRAAVPAPNAATPSDAADEARLDEELAKLDRKPEKLPRARVLRR